MTAKSCPSAMRDGTHHLQLLETHRVAMTVDEVLALRAKDVGHLHGGPAHSPFLGRRLGLSPSPNGKSFDRVIDGLHVLAITEPTEGLRSFKRFLLLVGSSQYISDWRVLKPICSATRITVGPHAEIFLRAWKDAGLRPMNTCALIKENWELVFQPFAT